MSKKIVKWSMSNVHDGIIKLLHKYLYIILVLINLIVPFTEYPCVISSNGATIFSSSQCLGGNVETIQISSIGFHSQFGYGWSSPLGPLPNANARFGSG